MENSPSEFEEFMNEDIQEVSQEALERIKELAKGARRGPWVAWDDGDVGTAYPVKRIRRIRGAAPEEFMVESAHIANADHGDGAYIASVDPETVLHIIARLEKLEAEKRERRQ